MEENQVKSKKGLKSAVKYIGIILSVVILWFMISEFIDNWNDIKVYLDDLNVGWLVVAILIYAIAFLATGYNWSYLLWKMDSSADRIEYLNVHMTSALARYIPGGIWNILGKAVMCNKLGADKGAIAVSMVLEYVFQIASSGMFLLVFIPTALRNQFSVWINVVLVLAILAAVLLMPFMIRLGTRIISKVMKTDSSSIELKTSYIYNILVRYIIVWVITGAGLIVLVKAFSDIEFVQGILLMLSYPISWVAGFLSPSPNGMGIREWILKVLLGVTYEAELLLLVTLTSRIWTMLGEAVAFCGFKIAYFVRKKIKS